MGSLFLQSKMMQIFLLRYDMLAVYIKQLFSHESEKISLNESMDSVYESVHGIFSFIEIWALSHFDQHESAMGVYVFPILNPPSHLPPHTIAFLICISLITNGVENIFNV